MFDSFHMDSSWLHDPPRNRPVQSLLHVGRELAIGSRELQGLTPFQLGTVSSKQECCWGPPCTHMWEATVPAGGQRLSGRPCLAQAHQHDLLPCPGDHHTTVCWHPPTPNTPARPCHPNHPRPRSPSVSVSWPREPHDFSVFLKTNAWLSSVSWWKNVKATDQMEAELIAW